MPHRPARSTPPPAPATFPEIIRSGRIAAGLTQEALAAALAVTQPTISEWEAGKQLPRIPALLDLAQVLGLDATVLVEAAATAARAKAAIPA